MFDLTRQEKTILIFLSLSFIIGLGINSYKKSQADIELAVEPYNIESVRKAADKFITEQRFININSLNIEELVRLPGVGEVLARRIIDYHQIHGAFRSKEELMQVKGIGEKKFEQIKDLITLE